MPKKLSYITLSNEQVEKIGNSLIYLSNRITNLSKTKALKLIYILDELSIKKSGIPFFNLKYKVWKFGPVSEEIFIDLSSDITILKNYVKKTNNGNDTIIEPIADFKDDEFSEYNIELMDFVIEEFGNKTALKLVNHTHRKNAPWHNTAVKHSVLELLLNETINNTEFIVDMSILVNHDQRKKAIYSDFIEMN